MFSKIQETLNEELKDKEFVYVSKYGSETLCRVKEITITYSLCGDKETLRKMKLGLHHMSPQKINVEEKDKEPIEVSMEWWGQSLEVIIVSTNGNLYYLNKDRIYFLSDGTRKRHI